MCGKACQSVKSCSRSTVSPLGSEDGDNYFNIHLSRDIDILDLTRWFRHRQSIFAQALNMERDGFLDLFLDFSDPGSRCDAARKVQDEGRIVAFSLFNDDGVEQQCLMISDLPVS